VLLLDGHFDAFFSPEVAPVNPTDDNLPAALARHEIVLPEPQVALLDRYCALLWDWNTKINLTRHTDYEKFVARDVLDSLAFARFLAQGERVLDVGTGGGVPGVVLAIVRPDLDVTMCDSVGKKARVVAQIVAELGLAARVCSCRAEQLLALQRFDTLAIRAVARLKKLVEWFLPHRAAFGRMLVLKGPAWVEERAEARHFGLMHDVDLRKLAAYPLPGTASESVLLQLTPKPAAAANQGGNAPGRSRATTGRKSTSARRTRRPSRP
jgi:16S rRNA (guanine527-N7)-methyltransferase